MPSLDDQLCRLADVRAELLASRRKAYKAKRQRLGHFYIRRQLRLSSQKNCEGLTVALANWVLVLDEILEAYLRFWQLAFIEFLARRRRNAQNTASVLLLGGAISQCFAVRNLCLSGFDVSAKICLRQLLEQLDFLRAVLDDRALASEFIKSDAEPEAAKEFWHRHLAKGRVRERAKAYRIKRLKSSPEALAEFHDWHDEERLILSTAPHPSKLGSLMSVMSGSNADKLGGVTGFVTETSVRNLKLLSYELLELWLFHSKDEFSGAARSLSRNRKFTSRVNSNQRLNGFITKELQFFRSSPRHLIGLFKYVFRDGSDRKFIGRNKVKTPKQMSNAG